MNPGKNLYNVVLVCLETIQNTMRKKSSKLIRNKYLLSTTVFYVTLGASMLTHSTARFQSNYQTISRNVCKHNSGGGSRTL